MKELPPAFEPVLAKIQGQTDIGRSTWYEVVFFNGENWCCYFGSKTFRDGEQVLSWKICTDIL